MKTLIRPRRRDRSRHGALTSALASILLVMSATSGIAMAVNTDADLCQANNQATTIPLPAVLEPAASLPAGSTDMTGTALIASGFKPLPPAR